MANNFLNDDDYRADLYKKIADHLNRETEKHFNKTVILPKKRVTKEGE